MDGETLFQHKLFQLSTICPGEPYGGFLARQRDSSAIGLLEQLTGHGNIPWILPTRLEEHLLALSEYTGSVEKVLNYHTLLAGFNRFLSHKDALRLRAHHLGRYSASVVSIIGLSKNGRHGHAWSPAICLECLEKDIAPGGKKFWRMDLLLSHIRFCPRHGTRIYTHCNTCVHGHRGSYAVTSPDSSCICGKHLKVRDHVSSHRVEHLELDIARGWSRLLDPEFAPHMQGPEFLDLVSRKARSLGLVNDQGVHWNNFYEMFNAPALAALGDSLAFPFRNGSVRRALRGQVMLRNPIQAIFLLIALFGTWDDVEAAISDPFLIPAPQLDHKPVVSTSKQRPGQYESIKAARFEKSMSLMPETIELYRQMRDANPHLPHSTIVMALPSANQFGLNADILRAHGLTDMPLRTGKANAAELDASGAAYIERRHKELVRSGARFRFTTARLLDGHAIRFGWNFVLGRENYPLTAAALDKYYEPVMTRTRRVLRMDILEGKFPRYGKADAERIAGMTDHQVKLLWKSCHRRSRAKPR
ncbi:hypothetical protein [Paraburkholderia sp. JHI869]|uniref:hypothetical protein n=1 Tax=Paraburkholderia sp. JHI869 TaxID=3112959 RepID=UPI003177706B